ncbi:type II secretion system protein [bacterium]|nr:type II secretion system protein [bacterium]
MKKRGFTLAELLITLGIIGVVSALTIPTLMGGHQKKVYVTQLQRVYNQISNAANHLMADDKVDSLAYSSLAYEAGPEHFLKNYFKVANDCGKADSNKLCFASSYHSLQGSETSVVTEVLGSHYCVSLDTGASLCITRMGSDEDDIHGYSGILVDVNGKNGPNVGGRDLFSFNLYSDGKISDMYSGGDPNECLDKAASDANSGYGSGCFYKVVFDGWKMDY